VDTKKDNSWYRLKGIEDIQIMNMQFNAIIHVSLLLEILSIQSILMIADLPNHSTDRKSLTIDIHHRKIIQLAHLNM